MSRKEREIIQELQAQAIMLNDNINILKQDLKEQDKKYIEVVDDLNYAIDYISMLEYQIKKYKAINTVNNKIDIEKYRSITKSNIV